MASIQVRDLIPGGGGSQSAGTGTIIDAKVTGNILQFGIVTAAHVIQVSNTGISLAFYDGSSTYYLNPDITYVATGGGASADLAYIGVAFDLSSNGGLAGNSYLTNYLESIAPAQYGADPVSPSKTYQFQTYGFGISAEVNPDTAAGYAFAYDPTNSSLAYGTERFFTNTIDTTYTAFSIADGSTTYTSAVEAFHLYNSATTNYGVSEPGDSGAGMYYYDSALGKQILQGVIEFGPGGNGFCYNSTCGYQGYNYGDFFGGVQFTQSYVNWLQTQNAGFITPEPSTFVLGGLLVVGLGLFQQRFPLRAAARTEGK